MVIQYSLHFASAPPAVYRALATDEGRAGYWAESVIETDGELHYVFLNGIENRGSILESIEAERFRVLYFGMDVTFTLQPDGHDGTDMQMRCEGVPDNDKVEITAGWVSWLLAMKASVDFGVDLRNHDPKRTWFDGYADN